MSPGLTAVSGNGQVVLEQFRTSVPFVVQARDASGNPVPNLPLNWSITGGQGTISYSDPKTDANGFGTAYFTATSLTAGLSFSLATVTATSTVGRADFYVTTSFGRGASPMPLVQVLAPPQDNRNLAGKAGDTIRGGFKAQVVALAGPQQGFPIPNVGIRLVDGNNPDGPSPARCAGTPLSDSQGVVTCDIVLTGTPGSYLLAANVGEFVITPNAFLNIQPGSVCTFSLTPAAANSPNTGTTGSVTVTAGATCGWTAVSNANWITITSGASGLGNGTVGYSVSPNAGITRTGTLTIAGQTFTLTQASSGAGGPISVTTAPALPTAVAGAVYGVTISANGGNPPYAFSAPGTLPPGLSLNATTGALTGTPTTIGNYSFAVRVADTTGQSVTQTFTLSVVAVSPGFNPTITNASFPNGSAGAAYSQLLTSVGGCSNPFSPPPAFTVTTGSLPPGLSIQLQSDRNSVIAGTPTTNGTYSFTLTVTDSCGRTGSGQFTITIGPGGGPGPGGALTPSVAQLQFTLQLNTTAPMSQQVTITSTPATQFTAQAQMFSAASLNWLTVTPPNGATPQTLTVTATAGSLPAGVFQGSILVAPVNSASGAINIPVTLRVTAPPAVSVVPASLFFLYQQGSAPSGSQTLNVTSTGTAFDFGVSATTDAGGAWLFATPSVSTTPGLVTVTVNPLGLPAGTYTGTIMLTPAGGAAAPKAIPVTLSIPQTGPVVTSVVNAASFQPGPVAPGEMITIFGTAMGPGTLTPARMTAAGLLETSTGETRVLFDGAPAPLIYTSAGQVAAIVPYLVYGRVVTRVEVEYRGVKSLPLDLRVADSAPGIFTLSPGGQGAVVNQDGSINSTQSGATPGSIVSIYATGEGQTNPPGVDGRFMGDILARPIQPVTVQIGGLDAEVLYAGSAPGLPAGIMQVNARVPGGVARAAASAVKITVGRVDSQPGVTLFVN